jgi:hypothetical protein
MSDQQLVRECSAKCQREGSLLLEPPKTDKMVKLSDMMTQSDKALFRNMTSMFLQVDSKIYNAHPSMLVPTDAVIIRDQQGSLVGISAVSGG